MKPRTATIVASIAAAMLLTGCSAARPTHGTLPEQTASEPSPPAPLEEYQRVLTQLKQQEHRNEVLRERLIAAQEEIDQLYLRLSDEQKLRREAEAAHEAARAGAEGARNAAKTIAELRSALDATKSELAANQLELKTRRAELMKLILEQQQWNRYVLDRLRLH